MASLVIRSVLSRSYLRKLTSSAASEIFIDASLISEIYQRKPEVALVRFEKLIKRIANSLMSATSRINLNSLSLLGFFSEFPHIEKLVRTCNKSAFSLGQRRFVKTQILFRKMKLL